VGPKWGKETEYEDEFEYEYDWGNEKERGGSRRSQREDLSFHRPYTRRAAWKRAFFPGCDITTDMIEAKGKSGVGTYVAIAELNASDTSTLCERRTAIAKSQKK
jgi:hypothetical protein